MPTVLVTVVLLQLALGGMVRWPSVRPVSGKFVVDLRAERGVIDLPLTNNIGAVLYHFACRGVRESYLDTLTNSSASRVARRVRPGPRNIDGRMQLASRRSHVVTARFRFGNRAFDA